MIHRTPIKYFFNSPNGDFQHESEDNITIHQNLFSLKNARINKIYFLKVKIKYTLLPNLMLKNFIFHILEKILFY